MVWFSFFFGYSSSSSSPGQVSPITVLNPCPFLSSRCVPLEKNADSNGFAVVVVPA